MVKKGFFITAFAAIATSCQLNSGDDQGSNASGIYEGGTFGYDLNFLMKYDSVHVLSNAEGNGQVIVSSKYQGKVFTSTAQGLGGKSFGWVNYEVFDKDKDLHMNAYGGEDRLWLGPEGGPFSLYFRPAMEMAFENWHTPAAFDTESWDLQQADTKKMVMRKDMSLQNYTGTQLDLRIDRTVVIQENEEIEAALALTLPDQVNAVGFKTINRLTNTGSAPWTKETGAPCMWNLDMFAPSPSTTIIIPYKTEASGKIATTDYFGEIPEDRIVYHNGVLLFKADGQSRGKLGIGPDRALPLAGSFDAENNVLTITKFDIDNNATYLNQEWTLDRDPFVGDAVNAYNDGPLADGSQMGPFYEIESVSPAAFLSPNEHLQHVHSVYHFTGDRKLLAEIAWTVFNIRLDEVVNVFK